MALGYDAATKLYYPLGLSDTEGVVNVTTLPKEQATTRGLGTVVKMFFKKMIKPLTGKFEYPMLRLVKYHETEQSDSFEYIDDKALIQSKIADPSVKNIALFIHGFIGTTEDKVGSIRRPIKQGERALDDQYDLVLAFDYESLNTKIEETAADLQKKLAEIGLKESCNKHFTIIAHSMGGLVSRYFIEKLGGKNFVSHLIMLGTPNNGSELANLKDNIAHWLTLGLNGLTALQPYLLPISWLGKFVGKATITMGEQQTNSTFIQTLNSLPDAEVPYHIVVGNTDLLHAKRPEEYGLIQQVKDIFKERDGVQVIDLFLGKPNDLVVTTESISSPGQQKKVKLIEAASNHFSYFVQQTDGLEALAKAVEAVRE